MASRAWSPPASVGQFVQEALVLHVLQKGHHLRMRADRVRDVQERQTHLRRDVVGDGLRERVGRVLLAQPLLQLLVEPPRGVHRPHEHLMASRIEEHPLQLLDVGQDEVEQRRSGLRPDVACQGGVGRLAALDQLGHDRRVGLDRGRRFASGRPGGTLVGERRDEVAAVEDGLQRVSDQRIGLRQRQEACAARWRGQELGDVDEQPPARLVHRRAGRQLEQGEPEGLHGVGHHLLMTDGDVDVVLSVAGHGDREQRGDRSALDDLEAVVDQAPFDVLRAPEMRFDPPAELLEPNGLRIRQCRLLLPLGLDRLFLGPARRRGFDGKPLAVDRLGDDFAVSHLVQVRVDQAGDQGLAEAEARLDRDDLPVERDRIGREEDAGRMREDHLLHDDGHLDLPVIEAVPHAVGHGPLGEQRGPAPADVLEDRGRPDDVQVRVLLAGEGGRRQVLGRRARSDGVGGLLAETGERAGDRRRQIVGDGDPFEGPADLRAERADPLPVVRVQARQPIEPVVDRWRLPHDPPEGVRRHAKARRHADAFDSRKLPQVRALAANHRDLRLVDLSKTQHVTVGLEGVDPLRIASSDHRRMLLSAHRVAPFVACGEPVWSTPRGLKQAPPAAILWKWRGARAPLQR